MTSTPRSRILAATIREAKLHGIAHVTRSAIARGAGVPVGSLSHIMGGASLADIKRLAIARAPELSAQPADRRADWDERILQAAVTESLRVGYRHITRLSVADAAGVSAGGVSNYRASRATGLRTDRLADPMTTLRADVLARAVRDGLTVLVRQGLADNHPVALAAPEDLRARAMMEAIS